MPFRPLFLSKGESKVWVTDGNFGQTQCYCILDVAPKGKQAPIKMGFTKVCATTGVLSTWCCLRRVNRYTSLKLSALLYVRGNVVPLLLSSVAKIHGCYAPGGANEDQAFILAKKEEVGERERERNRKQHQGDERKTAQVGVDVCVPRLLYA